MFDKDISILEKKLGFKFKNPKLIYIALTHKSRTSSDENNQRLEFLGDSILSAVITEYLYEKFTEDNEGRLTSMRASLVNEDSLFELAKNINLNEFVLMSDEELSRDGNLRKAALADTYESIIGAIFLDQGYSESKKTILNLFKNELNNLKNIKTFKDPKSFLQEKLQSKGIDPPKYLTSLKSGPPHNPIFETKLYIGKKLIVKSEGFKKSDSEKKVATEALKLIESNFHSLEKKRSFIKKIIDNLRN